LAISIERQRLRQSGVQKLKIDPKGLTMSILRNEANKGNKTVDAHVSEMGHLARQGGVTVFRSYIGRLYSCGVGRLQTIL